MATTARVTADGLFEAGDGCRQPARAELFQEGLVIVAADGERIAVWKPVDLMRTMGLDGFRIGARRQVGVFVFDPDTSGDLIRALAAIPDADAPMRPRSLVWTMVMIVAVTLAALVALAWGFFWLIEWLFGPGSGLGMLN